MLLKIHEELDDSNFISFEDRDILDLFEEDIKDFAKLYLEGYDHLIIDEFLYTEEGGKKLKYLYDHSSSFLTTATVHLALFKTLSVVLPMKSSLNPDCP